MNEHILEKKIYYHDTDCGGVVYYANYLKHLEEARTEFFAVKGLDLKALSDNGTFFVVAKVEIDYKAPARYQDRLRIFTRIEHLRQASIHFLQKVAREDKAIVEARTTLVCVGTDFKPKQIPEELKKAVETS